MVPSRLTYGYHRLQADESQKQESIEMGWIASLPATTAFEAVLAQRPELLSRFRTFMATLNNGDRVPRRMLELCRLRVAAIHECTQEWQLRTPGVQLLPAELDDLQRGVFARFSADERAALAIAEQLPYAHHNVSDADVEAVRLVLAEAGTVALLTSIAFFDVSCRMKLTLGIASATTHAEADGLARAVAATNALR